MESVDFLVKKNVSASGLKAVPYFQQILEYSLDMICTTDANGYFVSMSRAVETILGYTVEEIIGMPFIKFVHPEDVRKTLEVEAQVFDGIPISNFTNRYRTKKGAFVYISWCSIWSDENQLMYGVARDVTEAILKEQKNLANERKLAESEYFLSEVGKIARVGGWEHDVPTNISRWSQAVYDIYQLPYDYDPNNDDNLRFYTGSNRTKLEKAVKEGLESGTPWDLELELTTNQGRVIWVRSYGEAVYENTKLVKLRGVFMDVDKYCKNEAALKRSVDLLTQHNQQLNSFTHILSHNLRNHANNIAMLTSFLDLDALDSGNAELVAKLGKVSQNLSGTLEEMSNVIKIQERVIESDTIHLPDAIQETLGFMEGDLNFHKAEISTCLEVTELTFPKIYLQSILTNLISNSVKYKQETRFPKITIKTTLQRDTNYTLLEYTDNGIGIDLHKFGDKVFGLYKTFSDHPEAHGVGLFLVKTQIESQGGQVSIDSVPNEGTKFNLLFKSEAKKSLI